MACDIERIDVAAGRVLFFARQRAFCPDLDIFINSATAPEINWRLAFLPDAGARRRPPRGSPRTAIPAKKKTFRLA
jgi:hypothetical protein